MGKFLDIHHYSVLNYELDTFLEELNFNKYYKKIEDGTEHLCLSYMYTDNNETIVSIFKDNIQIEYIDKVQKVIPIMPETLVTKDTFISFLDDVYEQNIKLK